MHAHWTINSRPKELYRAYTRGDRRRNRSERSSRQSPRRSPRVYTTGDRRQSPVGCSIKHVFVAATIACSVYTGRLSRRSSRRRSPRVYDLLCCQTLYYSTKPKFSSETNEQMNSLREISRGSYRSGFRGFVSSLYTTLKVRRKRAALIVQH